MKGGVIIANAVCTRAEIKAVLQLRKLKIKFTSRAQPMTSKVKVALVRTMKAFGRGGYVESKFYTPATSAVDGGVSSVSSPLPVYRRHAWIR
jgi:hypothetical protein